MLDWLWSSTRTLFEWLGIFNKNATLIFLGLDNAGKSSLLHMLRFGMLKALPPTQQSNSDEFDVGRLTCRAFDIGGHKAARRIWRDFFPQASAIIFVVDAHDEERLLEAKEELDGLLSAEGLADVPFVILGNKVDLGRCLSEAELVGALGLRDQMTGKSKEAKHAAAMKAGRRPLELFMCSVTKKFGYGEAFKWLADYV